MKTLKRLRVKKNTWKGVLGEGERKEKGVLVSRDQLQGGEPHIR